MTHKPYEISGLSLVVHDRGGGADAIGLLTLSEAYLEAAEKLIPAEKSFIPIAGSPESLLTGHALELCLKSFLLACGIPADYLKKKIGHNLRRCLEEAEKNGIGKISHVSLVLRDGVDLLSDEYHGKHLEYFTGTRRAVRPDLRQLLPEIRNVCDALHAVYVDASKAERAQRSRPRR